MQNSVMKSFVSDQHRMGLFYIYNPGALMHLIDVLRNPPLGIYELLSSSKEPLVVQYTTDLLYPLIIKSMRKIYEKSPANPTESKACQSSPALRL
jgi:hypothetical protein